MDAIPWLDPCAEPEYDLSDRPEHYRSQNYRPEWEAIPILRDWLSEGKNSKRARCVLCDVEMTADICVIKSHGKGAKHMRRVRGEQPTTTSRSTCGQYNIKWENDPEYSGWLRPGRLPSKAECELCDVEFRAEKTVLRNHAKSKRHARAANHARRVREIAKIWVKDKNLCDSSSDEATEDDIMTQPQSPSIALGDRLTDTEVTKLLTRFIVKGFKRLAAKCQQCQSPLLRDQQGTELCVVCSETAHNNGYFINTGVNEATVDTSTADDSDSALGSANAIKMEVEEEEEESCISVKDDTLLYYAVMEEDEQLPPDRNMCLIQGLDLSSDVTRLVRTLQRKLAALNTQIVAGQDLEQALVHLDKIVALLDKIKRL